MNENVYLVWCPEYGESEDEAEKIEASDAEEAAAEWAARRDIASAEYSIVGGDDAIVNVKNCSTGEAQRLCVSGESVPQYYARELAQGE